MTDSYLLFKLNGELVKDRRKNLDYTQKQLGNRVGIYQTYISQIEREEREVSEDMLEKLAYVLQIEPWRLILQTKMVMGEPDENLFYHTEYINSLRDALKQLAVYKSDIDFLKQENKRLFIELEGYKNRTFWQRTTNK